jgi:predicted ATPase
MRLSGEIEYLVEPLTLPASTRNPTPQEAETSAAVQLFLQRARSVDSHFAITTGTAADVTAICWRLGGLPLAVELAASKVKLLSPRVLLERLDDVLATGWSRDLPARQHSLGSTLDWSYQLLDDDTRLLLRRLSVFAGGFTLEAVEALTGPLAPGTVLALLETLVEHSLVTVRHDHDGATQYGLLEPIRQFAGDLLRENGEEHAARDAHVAYFLAFAEQAAPQYHGHDQVLWLERTEWQTDNLRAAMAWALASGDGQSAARLGWALWQRGGVAASSTRDAGTSRRRCSWSCRPSSATGR